MKLLLNGQSGCSAFCQYICFAFFIFHSLLTTYVTFPPSEWLQWITKRVINRETALHGCDYSAPRSAGSMLSSGSQIFAFCTTQSSINTFSLPKALKLFIPQRLITLPSSYNLLTVVGFTQVTWWPILMLSWPILTSSFQIKQLLIDEAVCELLSTWVLLQSQVYNGTVILWVWKTPCQRNGSLFCHVSTPRCSSTNAASSLMLLALVQV